MIFVQRTYECVFEHRWSALVQKGAPPPEECPICKGIVEAVSPIHEPEPGSRSDTVGAPLIRSARGKAVAKWEHNTMVRPHFDDGKPLLTNFKDNLREGDVGVVPETVSSNETMRMTKDMIDQAAAAPPMRDTFGGSAMARMGGGWQGASPEILQAAGGPQNLIGRPTVDLKSAKRA